VRKLLQIVFILAFMFGGWALAAASLHVVRAPATHKYCPVNIQFVTKDRLSFKDTWVDVTQWTPADVKAHPDVVARLEETGKSNLLDQASVAVFQAAPAGPRQAEHN
jgi:hypothetical protein